MWAVLSIQTEYDKPYNTFWKDLQEILISMRTGTFKKKLVWLGYYYSQISNTAIWIQWDGNQWSFQKTTIHNFLNAVRHGIQMFQTLIQPFPKINKLCILSSSHGYINRFYTKEHSQSVALKQIYKQFHKFHIFWDLVILDSCVMSSLENIIQLSPYAKVLLTYPEFAPWLGMVHATTFSSLFHSNLKTIATAIGNGMLQRQKAVLSYPTAFVVIDLKQSIYLAQWLYSHRHLFVYTEPSRLIYCSTKSCKESYAIYDLWNVVHYSHLSNKQIQKFNMLFRRSVLQFKTSRHFMNKKKLHGISFRKSWNWYPSYLNVNK